MTWLNWSASGTRSALLPRLAAGNRCCDFVAFGAARIASRRLSKGRAARRRHRMCGSARRGRRQAGHDGAVVHGQVIARIVAARAGAAGGGGAHLCPPCRRKNSGMLRSSGIGGGVFCASPRSPWSAPATKAGTPSGTHNRAPSRIGERAVSLNLGRLGCPQERAALGLKPADTFRPPDCRSARPGSWRSGAVRGSAASRRPGAMLGRI